MRIPQSNSIFRQKYEVHERLGRGGFASVFRATDLEVGRDVAIKVLLPDADGTYPPGIEARFMVEARVIAGLQDPHTIRLFEFGKADDGLLYMVFQYVSGTDLGVLLREIGALQPETAVHITRQLLHALAEAHQVGVLHRDVKPANVLVHEYAGDPYSVKLLDFGIAKVTDNAGGGLTKTGTMLGTPRYMAPEQVFGEPLSPATDIYSVGLLIFEMLTGEPAVKGAKKDILNQHLSDDAHEVPPQVAWPTLRVVVDRMVARDPGERFQSVKDVIVALDHALQMRSASQPVVVTRSSESAPIVVQPPVRERDFSSTSQRAAITVEQHASTPWGLGIALGLLVALAITGVVMWTSDAPPEPTVRPLERALPPTLLKTTKQTTVKTPTPKAAPQAAASPPADAGRRDAAQRDRDGCGASPPTDDKLWIPLPSTGGSARVYIPYDYDAAKRHPVILGLQPKYITVGQFANQSGLTDLLEHPVILAMPEPQNRFDPWDDARQGVEAARATIDALDERFCIDRDRIFVVGHHDGAKMAGYLMCEMPLAGVALSGFAEKSDRTYCEPTVPVPTLWVVGRDDDFIPLVGGEGCTAGPYFSFDGQVENWKRRNVCVDDGRRWKSDDGSKCTRWSCEAPFVSCLAKGGHHLDSTSWNVLYPRCDAGLLKFDVAEHAWRFFQEVAPAP